MKILINTDKTIQGDEKHLAYFNTQIAEALTKYSSHINKIDVYISDQNGIKEGVNDIKCLLEVQVTGQQSITVSNRANLVKQAVSGAIEKLKASLETVIGRLHNHHQ